MTDLAPKSLIPLDNNNWNYKSDFPSLYNKEFSYLDSASSAQKPQSVIDAMTHVMTDHYANVHRGLYNYSQKTTEKFESVREQIKNIINANSINEVVFTRNTTEAINLVAHSWGRHNLNEGDEIIITAMEHHANIVPWQMLRDEVGIILKIIPVFDDGTLDMQAYQNLLSENTKLVSVVHTSNAIGTVNDVEKIISLAKSNNSETITLIDATQAVVHDLVDVQLLGCDFLTFTGHKLYGPTGIGVLWGKEDILNAMPPYQGGGDMIETVTFEQTTYKPAPSRFEAGTPSIIDVIGLGAAIDYVKDIGMERIIAHEQSLLQTCFDGINGMNIIGGKAPRQAPVLSFTMDNIHHSDIAMILNQSNIAVRTGHHCCMPLMQQFEIEGTVRVSFGLYNDMKDVNRFLDGMEKVKRLLA
jgi:cysteine desulfurase/selenocysteine lyase